MDSPHRDGWVERANILPTAITYVVLASPRVQRVVATLRRLDLWRSAQVALRLLDVDEAVGVQASVADDDLGPIRLTRTVHRWVADHQIRGTTHGRSRFSGLGHLRRITCGGGGGRDRTFFPLGFRGRWVLGRSFGLGRENELHVARAVVLELDGTRHAAGVSRVELVASIGRYDQVDDGVFGEGRLTLRFAIDSGRVGRHVAGAEDDDRQDGFGLSRIFNRDRRFFRREPDVHHDQRDSHAEDEHCERPENGGSIQPTGHGTPHEGV